MDRETEHMMAIGEFKARCLKEIELVKQTGEPLVITKRGEPVVMVVPYTEKQEDKKYYGCLQGSISSVADIITPIEEVWDVEQDEE